MSKLGFIVQARMGSTRLPGKMMLPFYKRQGILEVVLSRLKKQLPVDAILVATTTASKDDPIEALANKLGLKWYRGSETDVLQRFIDAAEKSNVDQVIRICADNPMLDVHSIIHLANQHLKNGSDYTAYRTQNGTPSIRTHFGFWGEAVSLQALRQAANSSSESFYHEHVTNYIYTHESEFNINWLELDEQFSLHEDKLRFTIDTQGDFDRVRSLFPTWIQLEERADQALALALASSDMVASMKSEIKIQSK